MSGKVNATSKGDAYKKEFKHLPYKY